MKKSLFLALVFISHTAFSQVSIEKKKLVKDGQAHKFSEYKEVFGSQAAINYLKKARTNKTVGSVFAGVGGGLMGFGLSRALSGGNNTKVSDGVNTYVIKKDNSGAWSAFGIGVALVGVGIPFAISANKNIKKAIAEENGEATAFQPYFKLETSGNAVAFSYNF